ncbi:MAG TPA: hypothetical protein DIT89_16025 [Planctomycetaceae bacterium]|nr:hypothetical protein [Planctomycetaceae bacterium]
MRRCLPTSKLAPVRLTARGVCQCREGLSLLEVVLGTALLAMALAVLAQQSAVGVKAAVRCQLISEATVLCQTQLDRILAGGLERQSLRASPIEGREGWMWTAEERATAIPDLQRLTVEVYKSSQPVLSRCRLVRLVASRPEGGLAPAAESRVTSTDGMFRSGAR